MSLRESSIARLYYRAVDKGLLSPLSRVFSHPDQLTLFGAAVSALTPIGFYLHPGIGFSIILISGIFDSLDGLMARKTSQSSTFGAFLDSSLDRVSDFFYLAGFWVLFRESTYFALASLVIMIAILSTVLISYVKARAEGLGGSCKAGLMGRAQRVIYLLAWGLVLALVPSASDPILWAGLLVYTMLTVFTAVQRIIHVKKTGLQ